MATGSARFRNDPHNPHSLSGGYVSVLFKDRSGKLWVGSDHFLDRYDPATESFTHFPSDPTRFQGPVFHIREDQEGMLWLATDHGLNRLDPSTWDTIRYQHRADDPASLSSDQVRCTFEDRNGTFWVATMESLEAFDCRTGTVLRRIPLHLKYRSLGTLSLLEDHQGTLWIGSVNGLAAVDRQRNQLVYWPLTGSGPNNRSPRGCPRFMKMLTEHYGWERFRDFTSSTAIAKIAFATGTVPPICTA